MTSPLIRFLAVALVVGIIPACGNHHRGGSPSPSGGGGAGHGDAPPTVSVTSPRNGDTFSAGSTIIFRADASDPDGTVVRVDFFQGSDLLATSTQAPFFFTWTGVPAGTYSLTAVATDNGAMATRSEPVTITVKPASGPMDQPPVVTLTAPPGGSIFMAPATITITASASDPDGTVTQVAFFHGESLIGTATSSPFTITWTDVPSGTYSLSAVATDNGGASTTSSPISITVDQAPTVSITSPSSGATFTAPATIEIDAEANDPDGTVQKVDFFQGSTLLGTATQTPFKFTWSSVPAGTYSLSAVATDNGGMSTRSAAVAVTVNPSGGGGGTNQPPTVSITSPVNGATFSAPATISITAQASDPDGTVAKVDFFHGTTLIGTATASPFTVTWSDVPAGNYELAAVATDNQGAQTTSSPVNIAVSSGGGTTFNPAAWTKFSGNPVFTASADQSAWDGGFVLDAWLVRPSGSPWIMYYSGSDPSFFSIEIGRATSTDGISWARTGTTPVLSGGPQGAFDFATAKRPAVVFDGTMYWMWYTGDKGIGLATSSDGIGWTKSAGNPVLVGTPNTWDQSPEINVGGVIQEGGVFKMWYNGSDGTFNFSKRQVGYATSTDGVTWTKNPTPVLSASSGSFEGNLGVVARSVIRDGTVLRMWYESFMPNGVPQIGYATSADGITWTKFTDSQGVPQPVLTAGPAAWEGGGVMAPFVTKDGNTFKMWYAGKNASTGKPAIGYATNAGGS